MGVAFIVDGVTEKKIVQALCPGAPVRMTLLNGRDVSVEALAKAVATLFRTYKGRHFPVFVVADRETRGIASERLEGLILDALAIHGIPLDQVIVSCPDRMIENWMLADNLYLTHLLGYDIDDRVDGCHGKSEISGLMRMKGLPYHEITVGVEIFKKLCPFRVSSKSASFARFAKRASPYCPWMRRRKRIPIP